MCKAYKRLTLETSFLVVVSAHYDDTSGGCCCVKKDSNTGTMSAQRE
jgi:hypothetical protein